MYDVPTSRFSRKIRRMCPESERGRERTAFQIRSYQVGDGGAISEICRESPQAAQWMEESYEQAHSSGHVVLVAELAGGIGGFVVARNVEDEAEILNTGVALTHRRTGIGSALLAAATSELEKDGVNRIYLEVRESNSAAIAFYRKHGFEKTGERRKYYSGPTENAVVMKKLTA